MFADRLLNVRASKLSAIKSPPAHSEQTNPVLVMASLIGMVTVVFIRMPGNTLGTDPHFLGRILWWEIGKEISKYTFLVILPG